MEDRGRGRGPRGAEEANCATATRALPPGMCDACGAGESGRSARGAHGSARSGVAQVARESAVSSASCYAHCQRAYTRNTAAEAEKNCRCARLRTRDHS